MAQKTAMHLLWEWIDANYHEDNFNLNDARDMSLKLEKEQIMKAYDDGAIETMKEQEGLDISKDQNGEESGKYYNEKYNK